MRSPSQPNKHRTSALFRGPKDFPWFVTLRSFRRFTLVFPAASHLEHPERLRYGGLQELWRDMRYNVKISAAQRKDAKYLLIFEKRGRAATIGEKKIYSTI